jgi:hypothetical protein
LKQENSKLSQILTPENIASLTTDNRQLTTDN